MEFSQGQDLCFGGNHADLLRQEFEEMDRELHTPSFPMKHQHIGEASSDISDPETDSESDCTLDYTDKSPMDKKEENVMQFMSRSRGCSLGDNRQACSKQFTRTDYIVSK